MEMFETTSALVNIHFVHSIILFQMMKLMQEKLDQEDNYKNQITKVC
jgi:hypothetical protein